MREVRHQEKHHGPLGPKSSMRKLLLEAARDIRVSRGKITWPSLYRYFFMPCRTFRRRTAPGASGRSRSKGGPSEPRRTAAKIRVAMVPLCLTGRGKPIYKMIMHPFRSALSPWGGGLYQNDHLGILWMSYRCLKYQTSPGDRFDIGIRRDRGAT